MAWDGKTNSTQLTAITTEQFFSQTPTTTPRELIHSEVEYNPVASPTDNLIVAKYPTLDASSENWDDTADVEFEIDNGIDPNKVKLPTIMGTYKHRIGVRRSGSTDSVIADHSFRGDGVDA